MADSFYWYDLETSGTSPKWDRIVQIAGCRTDTALNPVGDELMTYVRLPVDVLPNPDATLVTGITPQLVEREGISEWSAVARLQEQLSRAGTCALGYNSLRFDDEFVRYSLFRNFRDPYEREWRNGNSRWDLIDLVRATGALRRDGIEWPTDDNGLPVYKLEELTRANGIDHGQAHDAMADVRATIAMARLIRDQQPKLFEFHYALRRKKAVRKLLEPLGETPFVHVSGMYPRERFGCAPILPLCAHPTNTNSVIVVDLLSDVDALLELDANTLAERLVGDDPALRPGLKELRLNRCPFVAPLNVLTTENQERIGIDLGQVHAQAERLKKARVERKLAKVYSQRQARFDRDDDEPLDPDAALYDGFLRDDDRSRCLAFVEQVDEGDCEPLDFDDPRLFTLAERLKARQFPDQLSPEEAEGWRFFVGSKLHRAEAPWLTLPMLEARLKTLASDLPVTDERGRALLADLSAYAAELAASYPAPAGEEPR